MPTSRDALNGGRSSATKVTIRRMVRSIVRRDRDASEAGDSLVEVLIALVVLGLAGVALIGAFTTVIGASAEHRTLSTSDVVLKDFAESATNEIQLQQGPAPYPLFAPCTVPAGTATPATTTNTHISYAGSPLSYQPPVGFSVQITDTQYLYNNSTFQTSGCDSTQDWPQLITAKATGPNGSASLSFVVADATYESSYKAPTPTTTIPTTTTTIPTTTTSTPTTTTTIPTTTTTVPAPTIIFPTAANPYDAGHNQGVETLHITGTNLQNATSVTVSGAFSNATIVTDTSTTLTITLTGSGGSGAKGDLTVTTPSGSVTTLNSLVNGGTYNG
jgi:Tfp pilus assembly protein PilV